MMTPPKIDYDESQWRQVYSCPACTCDSSIDYGSPLGSHYYFGEEVFPFPKGGISLVACKDCYLIYKTVVPSPSFLLEIFYRQAGRVWDGAYDFSREIEQIAGLVGRDTLNLLDVGASNGALLRARADIPGRRSALDLFPYPEIDAHIRGEFIEGFLDTPDVKWSRQPYDVVTLFDVFEHLYLPKVAFRNLNMFVKKGGLVVIETGDSDSYWPRKLGVNYWWYVSLFEHHVFWSRRSIEKVSREHGFEIIHWESKRPKNQVILPLSRKAKELIKVCLYMLSPHSYFRIVQRIGKRVIQPWSPIVKDHVNVILKKVNHLVP